MVHLSSHDHHNMLSKFLVTEYHSLRLIEVGLGYIIKLVDMISLNEDYGKKK